MTFFINILEKFLFAIEIFILIRVVISWLPINRNGQFVNIIYTITEPILAPIRNLIEKSIFGGKGQVFDLSPLIAYIIIQLLRQYIR